MKHYIVANKEQELDILGKLEEQGFMWGGDILPTHYLPSDSLTFDNFPIVLLTENKGENITWSDKVNSFTDGAVFDGRKEEKMTEVKKYKVTKEFIVALIKWQDSMHIDATSGGNYAHVGISDLDALPKVVKDWWVEEDKNPMGRNRRLIAIISWLNGDDSVFEVEEPHKFVVRSENTDSYGKYSYLTVFDGITITSPYLANATRFSTREEAQEWTNSHQVVIEVGSEG